MEDKKENKSWDPKANKGTDLVKIKFRQNRAAEGVKVDENGVASVDVKEAEYLVSIGYADIVE